MNPTELAIRDIAGLSSIAFWPPAPGYYLLVLMAALCLAIFYFRKKIIIKLFKRQKKWQRFAISELKNIEETMELSSQSTIMELSELIRRIAMHKFSRKECASLEGKAWLLWLNEHDPSNYDWQKNAEILTKGPYAPADAKFDSRQVKSIINAIRRWTE